MTNERLVFFLLPRSGRLTGAGEHVWIHVPADPRQESAEGSDRVSVETSDSAGGVGWSGTGWKRRERKHARTPVVPGGRQYADHQLQRRRTKWRNGGVGATSPPPRRWPGSSSVQLYQTFSLIGPFRICRCVLMHAACNGQNKIIIVIIRGGRGINNACIGVWNERRSCCNGIRTVDKRR